MAGSDAGVRVRPGGGGGPDTVVISDDGASLWFPRWWSMPGAGYDT